MSIVQYAIKTNKREPNTLNPQNKSNTELKNSIKFSTPAIEDFVPKQSEFYKFIFAENTEPIETFLHDTQQQVPFYY